MGLVDGGGKSSADRKLSSFRKELDARDQDLLLCGCYCAQQELVVEGPLEVEFGPIAQSVFGADVAE